MPIEVGSVYVSFGVDLNPLEQGMASAKEAAAEGAQQVQDAVNGMGAQTKTDSAAMAVGLGAAAAGFTALGVTGLNTAKGLAMGASQGEKMRVALYEVGKGAGVARSEIDRGIEGIKQYDITGRVATSTMQSFIRYNMGGADAAAKLASVTKDFAATAGIDADDALQRITTGLQFMNTRMLRSAGIYLDNTKVMQEYATSVGRTASQLTEGERRQAMMNAIYEQATTVQGAHAAVMATAAGQFMELEHQSGILKAQLGAALLPALKLIGEGLNKVVQFFLQLSPQMKTAIAYGIAIGGALAVAAGAILAMSAAALVAGPGLLMLGKGLSVVGSVSGMGGIAGMAGKVVGAFQSIAGSAATLGTALLAAAPYILALGALAAATYLVVKAVQAHKAAEQERITAMDASNRAALVEAKSIDEYKAKIGQQTDASVKAAGNMAAVAQSYYVTGDAVAKTGQQVDQAARDFLTFNATTNIAAEGMKKYGDYTNMTEKEIALATGGMGASFNDLADVEADWANRSAEVMDENLASMREVAGPAMTDIFNVMKKHYVDQAKAASDSQLETMKSRRGRSWSRRARQKNFSNWTSATNRSKSRERCRPRSPPYRRLSSISRNWHLLSRHSSTNWRYGCRRAF
jgi:hypothetical protein